MIYLENLLNGAKQSILADTNENEHNYNKEQYEAWTKTQKN